MSLYLGIDVSTQSVKCIVIDVKSGRIAAESNVRFGKDLPQYNSPDGFLPHPSPLVRHADPMMWIDGMELALERLAGSGIDMSTIKGISGSGQQHGSVYLAADLPEYVSGIPLSQQIQPVLSRSTSPIWLDRSTSDACRELDEKFGSFLIRQTGSPAAERFTGPQIRTFAQEKPGDYAKTKRIHLVSSFMASVLCGKDAPIDYGDGAGMNLLDLHALDWNREIAEFTAPGLTEKLPPAAPGNTIAGKLHTYFTRYGLAAGTPVVVWSGDNPSSLVGTGCFAPGTAGISLGTSDTLFMPMKQFHTDPELCGHVFGNPAGGFLSLICFTNGSLAREKVREANHADWHFFDEVSVQESSPGNNGKLMLPYFEAESTPVVLQPEVVRNYENATAAEDIRAILESQMLAMRLHSSWIGEEIRCIRLTGGASSSPALQQIAADIFGAEVQTIQVTNSAGLGSAMRAASAVSGMSLAELSDLFCQGQKAASPRREYQAVYDKLLEEYKTLEKGFIKEKSLNAH